jgi:hypothetical protein
MNIQKGEKPGKETLVDNFSFDGISLGKSGMDQASLDLYDSYSKAACPSFGDLND